MQKGVGRERLGAASSPRTRRTHWVSRAAAPRRKGARGLGEPRILKLKESGGERAVVVGEGEGGFVYTGGDEERRKRARGTSVSLQVWKKRVFIPSTFSTGFIPRRKARAVSRPPSFYPINKALPPFFFPLPSKSLFSSWLLQETGFFKKHLVDFRGKRGKKGREAPAELVVAPLV